MTTIRAALIRAYGGPEVLELGSVDLPAAGPGEVLVRHTAIGLNYIDTYHRSGLYPLPSLPHAIGVEAAGVVTALGPNVSGLEVGQRVAYATAGPGAYAEARVVRAELLVPIPDRVSDEQAAAVLLKGMTVEYLVRRTHRVQKGDTVLWHAAAGGVGLLACEWLRHLGVRVIGTVGSSEKAELARQHGCDVPIVYSEVADVSAEVRALTSGAGVSVVYDSVGRSTFQSSLRSLAPRGLLVSFGNASGKPDPIDVLALASHGSLFLTRPTLGHYTRDRAELLGSAGAVFDLVGQGVLHPRIGQRFALSDVRRAHEALESRQTVGSSVILLG
ncbi:MAG TPA: quinone oxidoreductase [Polyangiaceae bacterium]|nr:quinone oxidoreductase [Polyangiaceae bacterium]